MTDNIFVIQGEYEKGDAAFPVIKKAASLYIAELNGIECGEPDIRRTDEGKPYLAGEDNISVSVTHSEDIWMCMVSQSECGIDFQYVRGIDDSRVSDRFFTDGERKYIGGGGNFFDIWTRREALGKLVGDGFFGEYPDTCPDGVPARSFCISGRDVFVHEITGEMLKGAGVSPVSDFRAACVSTSEELPVIKVIQCDSIRG